MQNKKFAFEILILLLIGIPVLVSSQLGPKNAVSRMKHGINLGNTLEPPYEGDWGNPPTQEYFFELYKNEGFDFIRVPVRWDKHMSTTSPFKIDETWLKRVEQILDWGLSKGLYMVVNSHHDDWIKTNYANAVTRARFDSLWSQVAARFKNKSEQLIFEVLNEPHGLTKVQNDDMHQRIISIIRKTNPNRLIIFQGHNWGGSDELITAAIPTDQYLIGSFHSYDPYLFGLEGQGTWGTASDINDLKTKFQKVKDWSDRNNIPVFLGEFGSVKTCDYNSRMKHYKTYMELCETFGFGPAAWDDGGNFRIMQRQTKAWDDDIKDLLTHSSLLSPGKPRLSIVQDTIVKLDWTNPANNYDSIYIDRKNAGQPYKRIAALKGQAITYSDIKLPQNKEYFYRVIAHYNTSSHLYSYPQKITLPAYVPKVPAIRELFTGQPLAIPGRIEAENFDIGENGLTYHDSDLKNISGGYRPDEPVDIYDLGKGVYYVIDNFPGEWLEYTVSVAQKGMYNISTTIAAFEGGGTFKLKIGPVESEIIQAPTTYSWINTKTVNFPMNLEAGKQIMRLTFIGKPLFYIDFLEFRQVFPAGLVPAPGDDGFILYQSGHELVFKTGMNQTAEALKIFTVLGSELKTILKPEPNLRISTLELHSGVYLVQLISGNQTFSKKIVIP